MNCIQKRVVYGPLIWLVSIALGSALVADSGLTSIEYIERYDKDGDGVLSMTEFPIPNWFSDADTNGDNLMDQAEISQLGQRLRDKQEAFTWVNTPDQIYPGVRHGTFVSQSMGEQVGYCIYLPPTYAESLETHYPVIYFLHGGRPGNETRSIGISEHIHAVTASGKVAPVIYVFVNGGPVSHYNYTTGNALAVDVFVKELIPHIDATYRTIANRKGRAIQGFSQGGRGVARIMFQYPELFISAAAGGAGYAMEKQISENGGIEKDERFPGIRDLRFDPEENAFDRARKYAQDKKPSLKILIWGGDKGFNYEATLEYMGFLYALGIPFDRLIVPDVGHYLVRLYESTGTELMSFHEEAFVGGNYKWLIDGWTEGCPAGDDLKLTVGYATRSRN